MNSQSPQNFDYCDDIPSETSIDSSLSINRHIAPRHHDFEIEKSFSSYSSSSLFGPSCHIRL